MAINKLTQLILVDREGPIPSKSDNYNAGKFYHKITLLDPDTAELYYTYVDKNNHNYDYWADIIANDDYRGLFDGFTVKKDSLLSGDSKPRKLLHLTADQVIKGIEFLTDPPQRTVFNRLFEFVNFTSKQ
jgi:hypothetical protein